MVFFFFLLIFYVYYQFTIKRNYIQIIMLHFNFNTNFYLLGIFPIYFKYQVYYNVRTTHNE